MLRSSLFQKYLLPGFVFQSIIIAGGYGTGRELVEYFLTHGPRGALLAILLNTLIWCAVCVVTFELARKTRTFDYRSFTRTLLGPGWPLYELCFLGQMLLVLAVVAAAAGSILEESFSLPYVVGVVAVMCCVGVLVFLGTSAVEKFLSSWSVVLYAVYIVFLVWSFQRFGDRILAGLTASEVGSGWPMGGIRYAAYNIGILPAVLFSVKHLESRKEALLAGALAGPIAILPGLFFVLIMTGHYPEILDRTVPSVFLLDELGSRVFQLAFQLVLLGTLIETGTGLIHAFNERLAVVYEEKKGLMPTYLRPAIALVALLAGALVAQFGLIELISKGYGTITWGFWLVFLLPVLTRGLWIVLTAEDEPEGAPSGGSSR